MLTIHWDRSGATFHMSVLLFLAVRQFLIGYDLLEMIPDWTYYVFATLVVLFLTRKIKRYVSLRVSHCPTPKQTVFTCCHSNFTITGSEERENISDQQKGR